MKILISGASGLIGSALKTALTARGDRVLSLTRRTARNDDEITWDPSADTLDPSRLTDIDGVIHLAGESIAARRWSAAQKARIRDSRVQGHHITRPNHSRPYLRRQKSSSPLLPSVITAIATTKSSPKTANPEKAFSPTYPSPGKTPPNPPQKPAYEPFTRALASSYPPQAGHSAKCSCPSNWDWAASSDRAIST